MQRGNENVRTKAEIYFAAKICCGNVLFNGAVEDGRRRRGKYK